MEIPDKIPASLALFGGPTGVFTNDGLSYNYAIGGIPFLSAASDTSYGHWWIKRETAPFRKQQFDSAQNPGEQSLDGYWLRSQLSFHGGAGQLFADPVEGTVGSDIRFWKSRNVDVWTPGTLSLLHDTSTAIGQPAATELISVTFGSDPGVFGFNGTNIVQGAYTGGFVSWAITVAGPGPTIYSCTTSGSQIFLHCADGLYRSDVPAIFGLPYTWTKIYTYAATTKSDVAWVKDRIVLGLNQSLYELSPTPAGPPAVLPTPIYTAKATNWQWTSITETTAAIYALGATGSVSSILKFTLDTSGDLPTLTGGTVAVMLPGGETAQAIFGYLGTFLAIGTSRGVRIAISNDQGDLTYGPLLWDLGTSVVDFTARDHWIWCTYEDPDDETIKLARVDLAEQLDTLQFAYATDLCVSDDLTPCHTVAFLGNSEILALATTNGTYNSHPDRLALEGWLQTSRVRFNTLEPKVFRGLRVRGPIEEGDLDIAYISSTGSVTPVFTYNTGTTPGNDDLTIDTTARDYISLQFTLNRNTDDVQAGASMTGWQIKALPGSPRQRLVTLPLWCFDYEEDKHGVRVGGQGRAWERLMALERIEAAGNLVTWQDLDNNAQYTVFIESLEFQQSSPPAHYKQPGGFGGRILIQMRVV